MQCLLVDGLNLVRRIYAAAPEATTAADDERRMTAVVASATASLKRALGRHRPSHCLAVFDHGGRNWRHQRYPDYKKNRPPMPPALRAALPQFERAFAAAGVKSFSLEGFEADDLIATLAVKIAQHGGRALILSTDRNYCQLLCARIAVFDHFAQRDLDAEVIHKRFQVQPKQLPDLLALAGDSGLSIPGVKSVGVRTAAKLLAKHRDIDGVLAAGIPGKLGERLRRGRDDARLAKTLFTLKTDIALGVNLNQFRYNPPQ